MLRLFFAPSALLDIIALIVQCHPVHALLAHIALTVLHSALYARQVITAHSRAQSRSHAHQAHFPFRVRHRAHLAQTEPLLRLEVLLLVKNVLLVTMRSVVGRFCVPSVQLGIIAPMLICHPSRVLLGFIAALAKHYVSHAHRVTAVNQLRHLPHFAFLDSMQ